VLTLFKIGFLEFTLIDLIDVVLVTLIIGGIYYALKNTIAIQILFGLIILIFFSFITEAVNLRAVSWILKTILNIWLIGFIVLFQPEIRKALVLLTRSRMFSVFLKPEISQTLDEIVDAVKEMVSKRIGALIVFPKSQNVQMTIDTGIPLQATVSKELILSIFNTKSPLHDGAVIIDGQTITAARCILPLSSVSKWEGRNLGTRHRAGLGLSEQVDAVVLIISEEIGSISIAYRGSLKLNIPVEDLQNNLMKLLTE
jgi:diadenylate cyclase